MKSKIEHKNIYISKLFSFSGPFNVNSNALIDDADIKKHLSDSISEAFNKNKIDSSDNFAIKNLSAFRYKGNALSFAANNNRVDVLLQKMVGGEDLKDINFFNFILDFMNALQSRTKFLLNRLAVEFVVVFEFEKQEDESLFLKSIFPLSNFKKQTYVGQKSIEIDSKSWFEPITIIKTISHGLVKEKSTPKTTIQCEIRTDLANGVNRFDCDRIISFSSKIDLLVNSILKEF